ncbi:MAG: chromate efflux transporter [Proteobacteria bacterium]|nr:chromate efflux transporter [Pseudomonadota bacterium]
MSENQDPSAQRLGADGRPWPSFAEALSVWARIALLSFGGPAGQIAVMHRILVEEKRWLGEARFLHALNFCMLLPGPEAQQLTVYIGWLMHKTKGGIAAGLLFVLPGVLAILALSLIYAEFGQIGAVAALFFGLKAAVLAIVLQALFRIGSKALKNLVMIAIAIASFLAIFVFDVAFPLIIIGAGVIGYLGGKAGIEAFQNGGGHGSNGADGISGEQTILGLESNAEAVKHTSIWTVVLLLLLWLGPVAGLLLLLGPDSVFSDIAVFFSKMAVVTFGGAYAVLAYVAQAAVETFGWLKPGEMLDGLGMAETTPGPLIMVTQFVGFMGSYRDPGAMPPMMAGILGGLLTTWVTFAPCFLWIFLGGPYIEKLRGNKALSAALTAITAAVVGVILNLAVWFVLHVIFTEVDRFEGGGLSIAAPALSSLDHYALLLTVLALVAVFRFKINVLLLIAAAALAGIALYGLGLI